MKYEMNSRPEQELLRKYKLAGKIRLISFSLLFLYLLLMKVLGGYSYLNPLFTFLFFVEVVVNQPHRFLLRRIDISRFQYYQMAADIIAITWTLYYMGGIEAPVVGIAYYAVILWAGTVSTQGAVLFAVILSAVLFSAVVIFERMGLLPAVSFYDYEMSFAQAASLIITNVAFFFAFGYFSAQSSRVVRFAQRREQEETLRNTHKLLAAGHLLGSTAHDMLSCLSIIKTSVTILRDIADISPQLRRERLEAIAIQEKRASSILYRLAKFSRGAEDELDVADIHEVIEGALMLAQPLTKYSSLAIERAFEAEMPLITIRKDQIQEVFVILILNALDAAIGESKLFIKTDYLKKERQARIVFSDTGRGIKAKDLKHVGELFFSTKDAGEGLGLGLATAYGIIAAHKGKIELASAPGKGTTFTVYLPYDSTPNA